MFRQKKGQAAMEFLMTYGWAILVVLAAIGALAYFGVLSPDKLVPERTTFAAPFTSSENAVIDGTAKTITVALKNNYGQTVTINGTAAADVTSDDDCEGPETFQLNNGTWQGATNDIEVKNGATFLAEWTCADVNGKTTGDRFEADLAFNYVTDSGLVHTHTGSVSGKVS